MPYDLLRIIAFSLPLSALINYFRTCKRCAMDAKNNSFWREMYHHNFPHDPMLMVMRSDDYYHWRDRCYTPDGLNYLSLYRLRYDLDLPMFEGRRELNKLRHHLTLALSCPAQRFVVNHNLHCSWERQNVISFDIGFVYSEPLFVIDLDGQYNRHEHPIRVHFSYYYDERESTLHYAARAYETLTHHTLTRDYIDNGEIPTLFFTQFENRVCPSALEKQQLKPVMSIVELELYLNTVNELHYFPLRTTLNQYLTEKQMYDNRQYLCTFLNRKIEQMQRKRKMSHRVSSSC